MLPLLLLLAVNDAGPGDGAPPTVGFGHCVKHGVAVASCFGFDAEDATVFLQAALSANASAVVVDKQPSPWIVQPLRITSDDITVHFADDVLVLAKRGAFSRSGDGLLTISRRRNVTLTGGRNASLQMWRSDYEDPSKYNHSEFRYGIMMDDSVDVTIANLTIADTGGDGILIVGGVPCRFPGDHRCVPGSEGCARVHVADCVIRNAYRNGMSVISAVDLLVERTVFVGTNGTNPKAGVDLEPDYPQQNFRNVSFNDCISRNNAGGGFTVALIKLNSSSNPVSISVNNLTVDGGQSEGLILGGVRPGLRGTINVTDSLVRDTYGGSGIYDKATDGAAVYIANTRFENIATHPTAPGMSHDPLIVYGSGMYHGNNRSFNCGGVSFDNVTLVDNRDRVFLRGDTRSPNKVVGVHGSISVENPFGCNMSFADDAEEVDVVVSCIRVNIPAAASLKTDDGSPVSIFSHSTRTQGGDYFPCIRIPSAIDAGGGVVLAFAECRRWVGDGCVPSNHSKCKDATCDETDRFVCMRRSTDSGDTFGALQPNITHMRSTNPAAVMLGETVMLFFNSPANESIHDEAYVVESANRGQSWSAQRKLQVGPGFPTIVGPGKGAVVLPAGGKGGVPRIALALYTHYLTPRVAPPTTIFATFVAFSDDRSKTWQTSTTTVPYLGEPQLAPLPGVGPRAVQLNGRCADRKSYNHGAYKTPCDAGYRGVALSTDGGETFAPTIYDAQLPSPNCQGSTISVGDTLLYSGADSRTKRENMSVWTARNTTSWPPKFGPAHLISAEHGEAAYSSLFAASGGRVGLLWEGSSDGCTGPSCEISLSWVATGGSRTSRTSSPPPPPGPRVDSSRLIWRTLEQNPSLPQYDIFVSPQLVLTKNGSILCFVGARKCDPGLMGCEDNTGRHDVLVKRSDDGGATFGHAVLVHSESTATRSVVIGNPACVLDSRTGRLHVFMCRNNSQVKPHEWGWYATTFSGVQLKHQASGAKNGRLIVCCDHQDHLDFKNDGNEQWSHSHLLYSDDYGVNWHVGGLADRLTNECAVAELANGTLVVNSRDYLGQASHTTHRAISWSNDGGLTLSHAFRAPTLRDPIVEGSMTTDTQGKMLVFVHPSSEHARDNITIFTSHDGGTTWEPRLLLDSHLGGGYSSVIALDNGSFAVAHDVGSTHMHRCNQAPDGHGCGENFAVVTL